MHWKPNFPCIKDKKLSLVPAIWAQKCEMINSSNKSKNEGPQPENAQSNEKRYTVDLEWLFDRNDHFSQSLLTMLNQ